MLTLSSFLDLLSANVAGLFSFVPSTFVAWITFIGKAAGISVAILVPLGNYLSERRRVRKQQKLSDKATVLPVEKSELPKIAEGPGLRPLPNPETAASIISSFTDTAISDGLRDAMIALSGNVERLGDMIDGLSADMTRFRHEGQLARAAATDAAREAREAREALARVAAGAVVALETIAEPHGPPEGRQSAS